MRTNTRSAGKRITLTDSNSTQARLLELLRSKPHDYISGERLSNDLNMSRTAIWKHINTLRKLGYQIEAITSVGYKLLSSPRLLLPLEIRNGLKTTTIGRHIHWSYELASTNTLALDLAEQGAEEGTVVLCEAQKHGRGRMKREWLSQAEADIALSIILRPEFAPGHASGITCISAISVVEALEKSCQLKPAIKWPNDIMIHGKKAAGILTELRAELDRIHHLIVGIGINVNSTRFPQELQDKATSLCLELQETVSRTKIVQRLLESFEFWYQTVCGLRPERAFERWRELSCTLGRYVTVNLGDTTLHGTASRMGLNGSLFVRLDSGEEREVLAGDVTMVNKI
ncbi:biotin--[acetyl-CoA-carboxylase] ligase [candidate division KSB3 bacterium]|uniref:Bifunctional ligase/repressor BirA n=1 Tax=candidate division KSB3 bacterium TaxID=2044937 RepID=A0A2G6E987_9BACT|nr:MAG: biotin--[acetyl-CoA-carboxylase] ligase [candidate division KSB3 bacterium]PIE29562.1 MAG: biotin--[acetyl-CoA-carboxylase] ligase [candidate division KSB3 bacterium]